ncbi:GTP cyclohydrolase 1 type 2/Nif3 [Triangularia setosa]|uniref:ATP phosphoribosyltransferase n=1 Tax=Triangularia setosa TaxID=2587417 RepID=A0AAN6VZ43_9PEZI|nr:GTP cyclohydrolase 1 type 2/Nif3 [Podospora setosa]
MAFLFRSATSARYKLIFYVPTTHLQVCKDAIFAAGAGRYPGSGNYTECCWTTWGTGQFKPGKGAKPYKGKINVLAEEEEARVETLCVGKEAARHAIEALKKVHPYEEPAYEVYKVEDVENWRLGSGMTTKL